MHRAQIESHATKARVIEFPHVDEIIELEGSIESRLHELSELVDSFGDAAFNLFLTEKSAVREAIEELVVKVSALDWIVRVAKHSSSPVREGLLADIEVALADLERTAEFVIRVTRNCAHADSGERREAVICIGRF